MIRDTITVQIASDTIIEVSIASLIYKVTIIVQLTKGEFTINSNVNSIG